MKWFMAVVIIIVMAIGANSTDWSQIITNKGFRDQNTYFIVSKGYPKEGLDSELQKRGTARDAAILFAQFYAKEVFDDSVDVIRNGSVENTEYIEDYTVVTYVIEQPGLRDRLRYF